MSDRFTVFASPAGAERTLGLRGHLDYNDALQQLRTHLEKVRDDTLAVLADLASNQVRVFHQNGIDIARRRKEIHGEIRPDTRDALEAASDLDWKHCPDLKAELLVCRQDESDSFTVRVLDDTDNLVAVCTECGRVLLTLDCWEQAG